MKIKKVDIKSEPDAKKLVVHPDGPHIDPDLDIDVDVDKVTVQAIDGVLIEGDDEEVRILFYHYKPDAINIEDETIMCQGVAEFRVSRSRFNSIAKDFNLSRERFKTGQKKIDEYFQEKLPMFA